MQLQEKRMRHLQQNLPLFHRWLGEMVPSHFGLLDGLHGVKLLDFFGPNLIWLLLLTDRPYQVYLGEGTLTYKRFYMEFVVLKVLGPFAKIVIHQLLVPHFHWFCGCSNLSLVPSLKKLLEARVVYILRGGKGDVGVVVRVAVELTFRINW